MTQSSERQDGENLQLSATALWLVALFCFLAAAAQSARSQILLPGPGIINTVAGNGTAGHSGDGGKATSAELDLPEGIAVDAAGNIYIADTYNNRIRKVTASTGDISTVAGNGTEGYSGDGGAATSAELNQPTAVAVDSGGDIYIADLGNNRVREVIVNTGGIFTVAGDGTRGYSGDGGAATSAELNYPYGVAVDAAFNIYIADSNNERVRKVTGSTGKISTVAGDGAQGYSGDGGAAISAELYSPHGVAVDTVGNIYIADYSNNRVRKVTVSTGIISTVAGNGTQGHSGDGGAATSAELYTPYSVAVDDVGDIYIADFGNERIREVAASTGDISTVAGDGSLGYSGDGGAATSAELNQPTGVAVDGAGDVYVADYANDRVRAVGGNAYSLPGPGLINTLAGDGVGGYSGDGGRADNAEIYQPTGVAVDASGNVYIADQFNQRVRKVTASTGKISTVAGDGTGGYSGDGGIATSAEMQNPNGVAVDSAGNIYIADTYNNRIRKVTASTGIMSTVAGDGAKGYSGDGGAATQAELNYPFGVAVDAADNIYIADVYNSRIRKVTASTGTISTVAGDGVGGYSGDGGAATSAELYAPNGVAVDSAGNIYIADTSNSRIRKVTASTGKISTVAGDGAAGYTGDGGSATAAELHSPAGVAVDTALNIYIADTGNYRIRKVTVSSGIISTVAGSGTPGLGDGGPATGAELNGPCGVEVDSKGNIYIADTDNQRIRAVGN
jgi:sugar lactone lactonase YvrE